MTYPRAHAVDESGKRARGTRLADFQGKSPAEHFGAYVFTKEVMQKMLPKEVYKNALNAMNGKEKINPVYADTIATAMKEWAISHGATHYTHWFQPLTGASAEKHDSFLDWTGGDGMLDQFSGSQLIQGEPDASSFPSGGLRSTYEARGYTGWDPRSPVFLWKAVGEMTLCIPTVFFSWTGEVLDTKIPLLRSDNKINDAVLRLLKLTGLEADQIYSTLGLEQEYFVIDRALRNLRPDLLLLGKTVYGAPSPKGQELQDHYLGSVKDRILAFMADFELEALKLSIPVKTRHNEVAPGQHEVAPVFERASCAVDHNLLLMELMRHIAIRHDLSCLLHEKPFKGLNGSGKHSNWSLSTDTGINLLDPSDTPGHNLHFLCLVTAVLTGVLRHADLLRASIGSRSNDARLGGHEAPPAIISVYLGDQLEAVLNSIEKTGTYSTKHAKSIYDLEVLSLPDLKKDYTDRNRTSPFAFTGNKFEFRAVGSSSNPAFAVTVLNAAVAESLNDIVDDIEKQLKKGGMKGLLESALPVIRKYLADSRPIRFSGDNYSEAWKKEAAKRKLQNIAKSYDAFSALLTKSSEKVFQGILTKEELKSRYEVALETYLLNFNIEINLMLDLFNSVILPKAFESLRVMGESLEGIEDVMKKVPKGMKERFKEMADLVEKAVALADQLKALSKKEESGDLYKKVAARVKRLEPLMEELRDLADALECIVDDALWPLPKYRELLFIV